MTTTLKQRAAEYFGPGNTKNKTHVALGRNRCAFVSPSAIWIYDETARPDGVVLNCTPKMRERFTDALYLNGWDI